MSEETGQVVERKSKQTINLGIEELQAIISASVAQAVAQSSNVIAQALIESRKPYVNPLNKQNEDAMRDQMREVHDRIKREIEASRDGCAHLQGSNALSEFQGQMGSFVLHQLDTGVVVGICTNCQKTIWSNSSDPAEIKMFSRKNANRMSKAGQRVFLDPLKAQATR